MYSVMMLHSRSGPGGTQLSFLVPENKIGMCDGICPCVQYNVHCPTQGNQTEKIDNQPMTRSLSWLSFLMCLNAHCHCMGVLIRPCQ